MYRVAFSTKLEQKAMKNAALNRNSLIVLLYLSTLWLFIKRTSATETQRSCFSSITSKQVLRFLLTIATFTPIINVLEKSQSKQSLLK